MTLRYALFLSLSLSPLLADQPTAGAQSTLTIPIEQKIQRLKKERDLLRQEIYLAGQKADQLIDQDWLGYRQALARQERAQAKLKEIDAEIKSLEQMEKKA